MADVNVSKARRFQVKPIETSYRSSNSQDVKVLLEDGCVKVEEALPTPSRRFKPVPVETSYRSSNSQDVKVLLEDGCVKVEEALPTPSRRFKPVPVETSYRSSNSRDVKVPLEAESICGKGFLTSSASNRPLPEPVETSFRSYRQRINSNAQTSPSQLKCNTYTNGNIPSSVTNPRKFLPQLIETSKRSKRVGDSRPATLLTDKTDLTPGVPNIYTAFGTRREWKTSSTNNYDTSYKSHLTPFIPRRQGSMRPHHNTRYPSRQASFTSNLDTISSSESESTSSTPQISQSLTSSLSESKESKDSEDLKESKQAIKFKPSKEVKQSKNEVLTQFQLSRTRESCDDRFSGYLLALAAKAAEKQLREQALLAAFPNESSHEIIEHFYDREIEATSDDSMRDADNISDSSNELMTSERRIRLRKHVRRKSSDSLWAIREMQLHKDKVARIQKDQKPEEKLDRDAEFAVLDPFWINGRIPQVPSDNDCIVEIELQKMRNAASPPMLGAGLKFRMCPSPNTTKFESDQRINIKLNRSENGGGLWGGFCVAEEPGEYTSQSVIGPSYIHTPSPREKFGDPFTKEFKKELPQIADDPISRPLGPDSEVGSMSEMFERSGLEPLKSNGVENALGEFDDHFVTQVYNYLSLGYPSLAWQFDEELSRISKVSVEELKQDDRVRIQGHIGLKVTSPKGEKILIGSDFNDFQEIDESQKCSRWRALKIYILEWGRQHPSLSQAVLGHGAWGVTARKGSWAF